MVDWIKCSFRNPREDECQLYDYDLEEPYGPFLVTIELSNGSRYSKQAYYRPKSNIWFRPGRPIYSKASSCVESYGSPVSRK